MGIRSSIQIFISLLVLVNPLEGLPFFLAGTRQQTAKDRARTALRAATAVTAILVAATLFGAKVLYLFGVDLAAFQFGGGVILFLIALQMTLGGMRGGKSDAGPVDRHTAGADIAIVPLAMPLLAGPGAVSGAILHGTRVHSHEQLLLLCGLVLLVGVATWASLRAAEPLRRLLKDSGIDIASRLMGLLIAAIAVQLAMEGLLEMLQRRG